MFEEVVIQSICAALCGKKDPAMSPVAAVHLTMACVREKSDLGTSLTGESRYDEAIFAR